MSLTRKQRRVREPRRRPGYTVLKKTRQRRRLIGFFVFLLLAVLVLRGPGTALFSNTSEETSDGSLERVDTPTVEQAPEAITEEEDRGATAVLEDPTLYLTVPKLGIYGHTVRNDDSEAALSLGAIKLPGTGFPWQKGANTYIACHRIGWPGTESYNQCLNLPAMQKGDEVILADTNGAVYRYQVSEILAVTPDSTWAIDPIPGRDMVTLQTCTETPNDWWTIGPSLFGGGPESGRLVVRADRVG